ncbi:glycosyltransferase family protein [Lapidilactobacillus gannanensis]|nr:hypothetical protein [Lapidilactobacillus gannanensis]
MGIRKEVLMIYSKLGKVTGLLIRAVTIIAVVVSFFFSMQSNILLLDKLSKGFTVFLGLFLIASYLAIVFLRRKNIEFLFGLLKRHQKEIYLMSFIFVIVYQVILLYVLNVEPMFDARGLLNGITMPQANNIAKYLSYNSNNRFIYFLNLFLSRIIGTNIKSFQIFNVLLITLSVYMMRIVGEKFSHSKSVGYLSSIIFMIYAAIQPLFLVPYTDTYCVFPMLTSCYFLLAGFEEKNTYKVYVKLFLAGFFSAICYLVRPSAIIFVISTVIFLLVDIKVNRVNQFLRPFLLSFLVANCIVIFSFNLFSRI